MDAGSPQGQPTTLAERVAIAEQANAGKSSREIAQELRPPLATVWKWRHKYGREGRAGLVSKIGRPATDALGQAPRELKVTHLENVSPAGFPLQGCRSAGAPAGRRS